MLLELLQVVSVLQHVQGASPGAGWVGTLSSPEEQTVSGRMQREGLAWCLAWLMAPELRIGPFLV